LQKESNSDTNEQFLWTLIAKNYEMIQGAQIVNGFILLMALSKATEPLSTTQISEIISKKSRGEIFKLSATLKDSLEYRLKRDGYVEGIDVNNKSVYSITATATDKAASNFIDLGRLKANNNYLLEEEIILQTYI